jgi:hypothetical protein
MDKVFRFPFVGGLWAATIIASVAITAHVTRSNPSFRTEQIGMSFGQSASPNAADDEHHLAVSAAYQDGLYLGKIARQHGEQPHISVGRWSTETDRAAFSAGYRNGFGLTGTKN